MKNKPKLRITRNSRKTWENGLALQVEIFHWEMSMLVTNLLMSKESNFGQTGHTSTAWQCRLVRESVFFFFFFHFAICLQGWFCSCLQGWFCSCLQRQALPKREVRCQERTVSCKNRSLAVINIDRCQGIFLGIPWMRFLQDVLFIQLPSGRVNNALLQMSNETITRLNQPLNVPRFQFFLGEGGTFTLELSPLHLECD